MIFGILHMTKKQKRFDDILAGNKSEYSFEEIDNFLRHHNFQCVSPKSSHFIYRRKSFPHITLVVHHKKVKRWYVKRAVQILKQYKILSS